MQGVLASPTQPLLSATFFPCLDTVVNMTQVSNAASTDKCVVHYIRMALTPGSPSPPHLNKDVMYTLKYCSILRILSCESQKDVFHQLSLHSLITIVWSIAIEEQLVLGDTLVCC